MPDNLKTGIENLSGYSMDDVKVHYNSGKPTQLNAYAYAQGTDIHIASGQEKHLPHEAWHVVQQKQGRVKPTKQLKGKININDDAGLEKEADIMGARALQMRYSGATTTVGTVGWPAKKSVQLSKNNAVLQGGFKTFLKKIKQYKDSILLGAEAIGHFVIAGLQTAAAIAGVVWQLVSGGAQAFIGVSKGVRSGLAFRKASIKAKIKARKKGDPDPGDPSKYDGLFNGAIAAEAIAGLISALFSGYMLLTQLPAKAGGLISSGMGTLSNFIKGFRAYKGTKKKEEDTLSSTQKGKITLGEAFLGLLGGIINFVTNPAAALSDLIKGLKALGAGFVGMVKGVRGGVTAMQGDQSAAVTHETEEKKAGFLKELQELEENTDWASKEDVVQTMNSLRVMPEVELNDAEKKKRSALIERCNTSFMSFAEESNNASSEALDTNVDDDGRVVFDGPLPKLTPALYDELYGTDDDQ